MERSSLCNNLKIKDYYSCDSLVAAGGFSWPRTCYSCSFCKREFRSAQALGGHMNVHRIDKARLMILDPKPSFNSNPTSSPSIFNFSSSSSSHLATKLPQQFDADHQSALIRPVITRDFMKIKDAQGLSGVEEFDEFSRKKREIVKLDLEIGLTSQSKEQLDLELRLGCSS